MGPEAVGCPSDVSCRRPRKSSLFFWKRCDWLPKLLRQLLQDGRHLGAFPKSHLFKQGKEKLRRPQLDRCQAVQRQARGQLRPIDDFNHCGQNNTSATQESIDPSGVDTIGGRRFGSPTRAHQRSWRPWRHGDSLAAWSSWPRLSSSWRSLFNGRTRLLYESGTWCAVVQTVHAVCPELVTLWREQCGGRKRRVPLWGGPLLRRLRADRSWCFGANNGPFVPTRRVGSFAKWWRKRSCVTLPPRLLALRASFAAPCSCVQKASFRPSLLLGFFDEEVSGQVVVFAVQTGEETSHLRDRTLGQEEGSRVRRPRRRPLFASVN